MQYVAFLRAINIGNRRIKMVALADVFRNSGCENVSTFIASGNVIFNSRTTPDIASLEDAIEREFLFRSDVFLRSGDEVRAVLKRAPSAGAGSVVEVSFLEGVPDAEAAAELERTAVGPEKLLVSGAEVFFVRVGGGAPTTHKESDSMRILGLKMTRRGLATVAKIHDRFLVPETEGPDSPAMPEGATTEDGTTA